MTRILAFTCAVMTIAVGPAFAQTRATITGVPDIPFVTVPNFLKLPPGEYLGESVAVATDSKGNIYVFHRRDTTRLFEFDRNGNFLREIGKGYYGFEFAHSVRVDRDDNVWTVDEGTNIVTKFSPQGKVLMVPGRRPPAIDGPVIAPTGPNPPAQKYILCRPTDVGFDPQGNIFISDGYCNNRVVKYDKSGRFVAQVGSEKAGNKLGEFNLPHGLQVDERGHVWVADRTNSRYQELDNDLKPIREITNLGTGWTLCISPGPHQRISLCGAGPRGFAGQSLGCRRVLLDGDEVRSAGPRGVSPRTEAGIDSEPGPRGRTRRRRSGSWSAAGRLQRPTDVAWDAQGNTFVADGRGNARVAKFSKDGVFITSWGQRGNATGQFATVDSIAVDAQGNVFAATCAAR